MTQVDCTISYKSFHNQIRKPALTYLARKLAELAQVFAGRFTAISPDAIGLHVTRQTVVYKFHDSMEPADH